MDRREALAALAAAGLAPYHRLVRGELDAIEARVGGRLGVSVLDTASGRRLAHREHERFPMCSTFKWLLAAQVLSRVDAGHEQFDRIVRYTPNDLLEYAPITRAHVQDGSMSVQALAEAAVEYSDNTAANLLLASAGGPNGLTAWLHQIGDPSTRLDRNEPALNTSAPGDPRDTTTPAAMVADLQTLLLGTRLAASSRDLLTDWLVRNTTGAARLRAGLPPDWRVGDKTGTGARGSTNDVAIVWPPHRAPILIAAYLTGTAARIERRQGALEAVGRVVAQWATTLPPRPS